MQLCLRAILAIFVGLAAVGGAPLPVLHASSAFAYDDARPVLAYYYTWWDPANFSQTVFQPAQAYNSDDLGMLQQHVREAQSAGIDGFVMSWYGNGDRTDTNLGHLLDTADQTGFRATIDFETPPFWGVEDVIAQLRAFYDTRIDHPAVLRYQGRPVIFFWRANTYDNATWDMIRGQVDPGHGSCPTWRCRDRKSTRLNSSHIPF